MLIAYNIHNVQINCVEKIQSCGVMPGSTLPTPTTRLQSRMSKLRPVWPAASFARKMFLCYKCWTDHVRNEEVLLRVNEQRNILREIRKRKANWIGHILRRNCLVKQNIEGKIKGQIEVTRRRGRRRKKLLDDLKDRRGYCQLKEEALDRTM